MKSNDNLFLKRLESELPIWVKKGWVDPDKQHQILDYVAAALPKTQSSTAAIFAIFGILLSATGVITFFAANWALLPNVFKLALLFSVMWFAYGLAYQGFSARVLSNLPKSTAPSSRSSSSKTHYPAIMAKFAPLFLLLGTLLFGANIWLIAQIYNIEAFYPTGVLIWSLAALFCAFLLKDSLTLALSITLGLIWTGLYYYVYDFRGIIHIAYLVLWSLQVFCIFYLRKFPLFNLSIVALVIWSLFSLSGISFNIYFLGTYLLLACSLFFIGLHGDNPNANHDYNNPSISLQHWGIFLSFLILYILAIPLLFQYGTQLSDSYMKSDFYPPPLVLTPKTIIPLLLFNFIYLIYLSFRRGFISHQGSSIALSNLSIKSIPHYFGLMLYVGLNIILIFTFSSESLLKQHASFYSLVFNILFFMGTLWLIQLGNYTKKIFYINLGCFFFALGLITRYFDTLWSLLNRSFFFMLGGILLVITSYFIEKYRRKFIKQIQPPSIE